MENISVKSYKNVWIQNEIKEKKLNEIKSQIFKISERAFN